MVKVHIQTLENYINLPLPQYQSAQAAGLDLLAAVPAQQPIVLAAGTLGAIPCGIAIELPCGYEAQIRPRSGLALKNGITVLNTPGTIDADYRGEIQVILINHSKQDFLIERGMRIAQMVIAPVEQAEWVQVEQLSSSQRGAGGFGSSGLK